MANRQNYRVRYPSIIDLIHNESVVATIQCLLEYPEYTICIINEDNLSLVEVVWSYIYTAFIQRAVSI